MGGCSSTTTDSPVMAPPSLVPIGTTLSGFCSWKLGEQLGIDFYSCAPMRRKLRFRNEWLPTSQAQQFVYPLILPCRWPQCLIALKVTNHLKMTVTTISPQDNMILYSELLVNRVCIASAF